MIPGYVIPEAGVPEVVNGPGDGFVVGGGLDGGAGVGLVYTSVVGEGGWGDALPHGVIVQLEGLGLELYKGAGLKITSYFLNRLNF